MSEMDFETKLHSIANRMEYPRTPDVAGSVITRLNPLTRPRLISRQLAWSLTVILVLFSSLLLIPSARAAIIEFIQIGVVRIFPQPVELTVEPVHTAIPESLAPGTATALSTTSNLIPVLDQMAGKTTLTDAQNKVEYPLLLPGYPSNLGLPDYVYVQNADGDMVILVWLVPQHPEKILMSLHFVPNGSWAVKKMEPTVILETKVGDKRAIWTTGPYPLILSNGNVQFMRLITGHVLIWADPDITYRLETDLGLEEAVKIAESLQPVSNP